MPPSFELGILTNPSPQHGCPSWPPHAVDASMPSEIFRVHESGSGADAAPVQHWNESWTVTCRVLATFWAFGLMGANDAAYGAVLPALVETYDLSLVVVPLIFLAPFVGYIAAAASSDALHRAVGQRGIALLGASAHVTAYIVLTAAAAGMPYPALVLAFVVAGFGNGVADTAWNAWLGSLTPANELLGIMHACYGVGGALSPALVVLLDERGLGWFWFYRIMIAGAAVEALASTWAFWSLTGATFRCAHGSAPAPPQYYTLEALGSGSAARVTLLASLFLLGAVGVEVALGGFLVLFMIRARHGAQSASGWTATGFWLGLAVGRAVLGFLTPRVGIRRAVMLYLLSAIGLELLFWLVPQFVVSAMAITLLGFFLGPLFPSAILALKRSLPKHLHLAVIGFASSFGAFGAALIPLSISMLAELGSVMVLQPVVLTVLGCMLILWTFLPKIDSKQE